MQSERSFSQLVTMARVLDHVLSSRGDGPRVLPVVGMKARDASLRPFLEIMTALLRRDMLRRMQPSLGDRGDAQQAILTRERELTPSRERQRTSVYNGLSDMPLDDVMHAGVAEKLTNMTSVMGYNTLCDSLAHTDVGLVGDAMVGLHRLTRTRLCLRTQRAVLTCAADGANRSILDARPPISGTAEEFACQRAASYTAPGLRFFGNEPQLAPASTGPIDALELDGSAPAFVGPKVVPLMQIDEPYGAGARTRYKALQRLQQNASSTKPLPSWTRRCLPVSQTAMIVNAAAISSVWFSLVALAQAGQLV